jgi:serine/threonine protein phosphatase PrpC
LLRATYSFGASVRGPLHQRERRPNEDAWLRSTGGYGSLVVVCDGMGSRPEARRGSKAACLAAREAVIRWSSVQGAPLSYLAHLVEVLWRLRIHPVEPGDAATTCLIALACPDGTWVLGGVGDGIIITKTGTAFTIVVGERGEGFANETLALGVSRGPRSWEFVTLPASAEDRVAILATDGIADDLVPEKLDDFCDWLVDDFQNLTPTQRWRQLMTELRAWPTPKHLDDKTLAVLRTMATPQEAPA